MLELIIHEIAHTTHKSSPDTQIIMIWFTNLTSRSGARSTNGVHYEMFYEY